MANYPIRMLKDEQGAPFVPLVSVDSVQTTDGKKLTDLLTDGLSPEDIVGGEHVTVETIDGTVKIGVDLPTAINIINNLTTESSGQGALDAYQGKVLYDSIPKLYDGLDSNDANQALTARQGKILGEKLIPDGGSIGQVLKKGDNGYEWGDAADPNAIGGDGSIKKIIEISYAQYKELEAAGEIQENIEYHIPEMGGDPGSVSGGGSDISEADIEFYVEKALEKNEEKLVPVGGTTGQVLKKSSDYVREVEWGDAADPNAISGDGSIKKIVELTYADYIALQNNNQLDDDTEYHINDWAESEFFTVDADNVKMSDNQNVEEAIRKIRSDISTQSNEIDVVNANISDINSDLDNQKIIDSGQNTRLDVAEGNIDVLVDTVNDILERKRVDTEYLGENPDIDLYHYGPGMYGIYNCSKAPSMNIGILEVLYYSGDWVIQRFTAIDYGGGAPQMWERCFHTGTTWTSWIKRW